MLVTQTHIKLPMLTYSNKTNGPPVLMLVLNVNVNHTLFIKTKILRYVNAQIYGD